MVATVNAGACIKQAIDANSHQKLVQTVIAPAVPALDDDELPFLPNP